MNIFVLDSDMAKCAEYHVDKHVGKLILEAAQLLCSPYPNGIAPYKRTHYNHPCAIWTRTNPQNYLWLCNYGLALNDEFKFRFGSDHASSKVIRWCKDNINKVEFIDPNSTTMSSFALAMPDECKIGNAVDSYREYYKKHKRKLAKWTNRQVPDWFDMSLEVNKVKE